MPGEDVRCDTQARPDELQPRWHSTKSGEEYTRWSVLGERSLVVDERACELPQRACARNRSPACLLIGRCVHLSELAWRRKRLCASSPTASNQAPLRTLSASARQGCQRATCGGQSREKKIWRATATSTALHTWTRALSLSGCSVSGSQETARKIAKKNLNGSSPHSLSSHSLSSTASHHVPLSEVLSSASTQEGCSRVDDDSNTARTTAKRQPVPIMAEAQKHGREPRNAVRCSPHWRRLQVGARREAGTVGEVAAGRGRSRLGCKTIRRTARPRY